MACSIQSRFSLKAGVALFCCAAVWESASAASISLLPVSASDGAQTGDTLLFEVVADFTDEPTFGGGFDIVWDPDALSFEQIVYFEVGDPSLGRAPDLEDGELVAWAFGSFTGFSGVHVLGQLAFSVLPTMGSVTAIDFGCSGGNSCVFTSIDDLVTPLDVQLHGVEVSRVPVPGAGVLFLCSLAGFRLVRRSA